MGDRKDNTVGSAARKKTRTHLQHHPALCSATRYMLEEDWGKIEFMPDVELNSLPREIDLLVILKDTDETLKSELGSFFRKCNIWEFKGYRAGLNAQVYHKTMSYAYEYLSLNDGIDSIRDVTLSFLRDGVPRKLFRYLSTEGYEQQEGVEWITRFKKEAYPDIQFVNIAHPKTPPLLRALSHDATEEDMREFISFISGRPDSEDDMKRLLIDQAVGVNRDKEGMNVMKGFFETYVDPLQRELEENRAQLEQSRTELEQRDAQLEHNRTELAQKDARIFELERRLAAAGL